ncbi:MAG: DUF433 domain-containing protein [Chloroflexia bacterium]
MALTIENDAVPIRITDNGNAVVGKTRVLLILVVSAFEEGCSPEEITERYTSLDLADVYSVIGYYLRHRDEIREYMCEREKQADEIQKRIEAEPGYAEWREKMLAYRAAKTT